MWPYQKKSTWDKIAEPMSAHAPGVAKSGLRVVGAVGAAVAVSFGSAAISALRRRDQG